MLQELRVLYVEDDSMSRKVAKLLFEDMLRLSQVTIFENSKDFLARAEAIEPPPNLILLDIHVAPLTGFEMLQQIRSSERLQHVVVAALTASVMNEEVQQLRQAGFQGAIAKPLDPDGVIRALERLIRGEQVWVIPQ